MILPQRRWEQVRQYFTDDETLAVHEAVTGEPAIQRGFIVDEKQLAPELRAKLKFHFLEPVPFPARVARAGGA